MVNITANVGIQVKGGPQLALPSIVKEVDAYDMIEVSIKPNETKKINVKPASDATSFLLIIASEYVPYKETTGLLQCQVGTDNEKKSNLTAPQLYVGEDTIAKLLGDVKEVTLINGFSAPTPLTDEEKKAGKTPPPPDTNTVTISILVGRNAIAPS